MEKTMYECDCCGRLVDYDHIIRMQARSGSFVTYANQDMWGADKKEFDICTDCLYHIGLCSKKIVDSKGNSLERKEASSKTQSCTYEAVRYSDAILPLRGRDSARVVLDRNGTPWVFYTDKNGRRQVEKLDRV